MTCVAHLLFLLEMVLHPVVEPWRMLLIAWHVIGFDVSGAE